MYVQLIYFVIEKNAFIGFLAQQKLYSENAAGIIKFSTSDCTKHSSQRIYVI